MYEPCLIDPADDTSSWLIGRLVDCMPSGIHLTAPLHTRRNGSTRVTTCGMSRALKLSRRGRAALTTYSKAQVARVPFHSSDLDGPCFSSHTTTTRNESPKDDVDPDGSSRGGTVVELDFQYV